MRGESASVCLARMPGSSARRKRNQPLPHRDAALQQEGADLIDDAGALTDEALADAVQGLQVKLVRGLGRDELHGRALHRLGDRLRIAEVAYGRTYLAGISRALWPSSCSLRLR
jgi:hypothetical protein